MKNLLTALILIALLVACDNQTVEQKQFTIDEASIIATVEGEPITLEQVQNEMRYRGGHIPGRFASLDSREALLDEIIHFEVLAQKAKEAGYENDPEIQAALKKMMVKKFQQDYLDKLLAKQRISDRDVQNYYRNYQEEFSSPDMFRPAVISMRFGNNDSQTEKDRKRQRFEAARTEAVSQKENYKDFGPLARKYSDDPRTRYLGGAMNWVAMGAEIFQLEQKVLQQLFSMKKPGEISPIIETDNALYLVKLINKQPAEVRDYKSVKDQIKRILIAKKKKSWLQDYHKEARSEFDVSINKEKLKAIPTPGKFAKTTNTPPGFPVN